MAAHPGGPLNLHLLLRLLSLRPQLLVEHGAAYVGLLADELQAAGQDWRRRAILQALGLLGIVVATLLAGMAALLWAALPEGGLRLPWMLWAVPLTPALLGAGCLWILQVRPPSEAFVDLRSQFEADGAMLRKSGLS